MRGLAILELGVVLLGLGLYPIDRGEFSLPSAVLAVGLVLGGTMVTVFALQPLARLIGRPFAWFFGAQGMLGGANLGRDRVRSGLSIGALIIGLASLVALGAVAESARATADRWVSSILPGGHAIRLGLPVDIDSLQPSFTETTGARYATPIPEFPLAVPGGEGPVEVSVAGIDPTIFEDTGSLIFVHGPRSTAFEAMRDGGTVLIPDGMATQRGLGVGSQIELGMPGQEPVTFEVAGIIAYTLPGTSPEGALLISLADARTLFGQSAASLWAMVPQDGITPDAFAAAVQTKAASFAGESLTAEQLASDLGRSLDRLIGLFDVLALLAVVIAALGIVNTLALGVLERAREIAVLRAHGMTTSGVQAMVVAEAAIMGAVGGVAAAITGLLTAAVAVAMATPADFGAGLVVPWPLLIAVVLLGTAVAALAGLYPARLAGRTPIVRSLMQFE
jgi:putative ABC transport system permease protein